MLFAALRRMPNYLRSKRCHATVQVLGKRYVLRVTTLPCDSITLKSACPSPSRSVSYPQPHVNIHTDVYFHAFLPSFVSRNYSKARTSISTAFYSEPRPPTSPKPTNPYIATPAHSSTAHHAYRRPQDHYHPVICSSRWVPSGYSLMRPLEGLLPASRRRHLCYCAYSELDLPPLRQP